MPLYNYVCKDCGRTVKKIQPIEKAPDCFCGFLMEREMKGPTSDIKVILDNGAMPRKVERLENIDSIIKERAKEKKEPGVI